MQNFSLHGNWVDLIIILVFIFYLLEGWGRGLLLGLVDLGGFLLSFIGSLKFYNIVADLIVSNFSLSRGIANAAGFLLVGFIFELVFSTLINFLYGKVYPKFIDGLKKQKLYSYSILVNKALGLIPAMGEAVIFVAFILTLLIALPIKGSVKKDIISSRIGGILVAKTQGIESTLNIVFGQAVNETLNFITINPNPQSEEKVNLNFTQKNVSVDETAETTMLNLVNQARVQNGLRGLSLDYRLRDLARAYAKDMFARGYFSHYNPEGQSPFDRMQKAGISFLSAGENLALAPNVDLAFQGLMNSPGHRANILSPEFHKVGVGVMDGGIYGEMFVQEFTN
ncbi:CvpA family protein [Patescibacteria group bacterium]|nr:CvpA family protein [Patescibacteria group bacterium]